MDPSSPDRRAFGPLASRGASGWIYFNISSVCSVSVATRITATLFQPDGEPTAPAFPGKRSLLDLRQIGAIRAAGTAPMNGSANEALLAPRRATSAPWALLPEALGWRGYAFDRLQATWNALTTSPVLARSERCGIAGCSSSRARCSAIRDSGRPCSFLFFLFVLSVIPTAVATRGCSTTHGAGRSERSCFTSCRTCPHELAHVTDRSICSRP